jgi:hypothetical protein
MYLDLQSPRLSRRSAKRSSCSVCHADDRRAAHLVSILGALLVCYFSVWPNSKVFNADCVSITFEPYAIFIATLLLLFTTSKIKLQIALLQLMIVILASESTRVLRQRSLNFLAISRA